MVRQHRAAPAGILRAPGMAAEGKATVVHDDGTGGADIHTEFRRDPHQMIAAADHGRRQAAPLGAQHIGGGERVAKARQLDGVSVSSTPTMTQPRGSFRSSRPS